MEQPAAPTVARVDLPELTEGPTTHNPEPEPLDRVTAVEVTVSVQAGTTSLPLREVLALAPGSVIPMGRPPEAPVDVRVNGHLLARADIVVLEDEISARISEIVHAS